MTARGAQVMMRDFGTLFERFSLWLVIGVLLMYSAGFFLRVPYVGFSYTTEGVV